MSSASPQERLARVALNQIGEPGDVRLTALVAELGAVELHRLLGEETDPQGLRTDLAARVAAAEPERTLEQAERVGARFVVPGDEEWPAGLDDLHAAGSLQERGGTPTGLWVRGPLRLDQLAESIAVVGARAATSYGAAVAAEIAAEAGRLELPVVSGGAFGIDIAAHRGALGAGGRTAAVLACGIDRCYPAAHRELINHLTRVGAVITETAPGGAPQRMRFLARNRIIAALARGTVVVEAAARSGALNTANWATRLNRPLMGVPGSVTSAASVGVHELIRQGAATLVTGGLDVLELVGRSGEHLATPPSSPCTPRDRLSTRQRQVLDAVPVGAPAEIASIALVAGLGVREVRGALEKLHRAGLVEVLPTGWRLGEAALAGR